MTRVSDFGDDTASASILLCVSSSGSGGCSALKCAINDALSPSSGISFPDYSTWTDVISSSSIYAGDGVKLVSAVSPGPTTGSLTFVQSFAGVCIGRKDGLSHEGVLCKGLAISPVADRLETIEVLVSEMP